MTSPTPQAPAREAVELPPLPEKAHQMDGKGHSDDRMRAYALKARSDVLDLAERLKQEAQIHAQEARTANATIAEIYQLCTGAKGEPGNWNGAEPVRALLAAKQEELDKMRADAERYRWLREGDNDEKVLRFDEFAINDEYDAWLLRSTELDEAIDAELARQGAAK